MAYIVVNSKYNPFSFDEMVRPFQMYGEAYREQEAAANDLATKAAVLENLSPETDRAQYDSYKGWLAELQKASSDLATTGLNPQLRSTITQLGNRYSSEYAPLEEKIKTRGELVKEQRAFQQKNPNAFFDVDYDTVSLDQISPSSTFTSYNPDTIATSVGNDVYNKLNSGEAVPSMNEYLTQYGAGLKDVDKIAKIQKAIATGASLGNATYQQKEFDNYIKKVQATRRYSSSGSNGGTSGIGGNYAVRNHEGSDIIATYDKKLGAYKIKDKNKKDVVIQSNNPDDVLRGYYGGDYDYINVFGSIIPRVKTTQTLENGKSRDVYSVLVNGQWVELPRGGNTTKRELYKTLTKQNLSALTAEEKKRRGINISDEELARKVAKKGWKAENADYHDYVINMGQNLVDKLDALESVGATFNTTIYRDNNGKVIGWDIASTGDDIDTPIEYIDNYPE